MSAGWFSKQGRCGGDGQDGGTWEGGGVVGTQASAVVSSIRDRRKEGKKGEDGQRNATTHQQA